MVTIVSSLDNGRPKGFDSPDPWHVLHVRPRCEKKTRHYCFRFGIDSFLPLREQTKVYQRRKVTTRIPVFPGYLFATFPPELRTEVMRSNMVAHILPAGDQRTLSDQLRQVDSALQVDPCLGASHELARGQRVRITAGPFAGIEGVVQSMPRRTRVILNIEMIGQSIAVEVDASDIEPVAS